MIFWTKIFSQSVTVISFNLLFSFSFPTIIYNQCCRWIISTTSPVSYQHAESLTDESQFKGASVFLCLIQAIPKAKTTYSGKNHHLFQQQLKIRRTTKCSWIAILQHCQLKCCHGHLLTPSKHKLLDCVSPELMSLKNLMSHDNRIPGWKAVCGKAPGRCTADLALLPCSCAAEEQSQPSQGTPRLAKWVRSHCQGPGAHPMVGNSGHLLKLLLRAGAARQIQQLLWSSLLPPWWEAWTWASPMGASHGRTLSV